MILYVLIAFVVYLVMSQVLFPSMKTGVKVEDVSYSTFVEKLEAKEVSNLEYTQDASSVALYQLEGEKDIAYRTTVPAGDSGIWTLIRESGADTTVDIPDQNSGYMTYILLTVVLPIAIFFLAGWWLNRRMKKAMGDDNPSMNFAAAALAAWAEAWASPARASSRPKMSASPSRTLPARKRPRSP